jgi:hypothetical protein
VVLTVRERVIPSLAVVVIVLIAAETSEAVSKTNSVEPPKTPLLLNCCCPGDPAGFAAPPVTHPVVVSAPLRPFGHTGKLLGGRVVAVSEKAVRGPVSMHLRLEQTVFDHASID